MRGLTGRSGGAGFRRGGFRIATGICSESAAAPAALLPAGRRERLTAYTSSRTVTKTADKNPSACKASGSRSGCAELHSKSSRLSGPSRQKRDAPNGFPPKSGEATGHSAI